MKQAESEEPRATVTIFGDARPEPEALASTLAALPPGTLAVLRSILSALHAGTIPDDTASETRNPSVAAQAHSAQALARGGFAETHNRTVNQNPSPTAPRGAAAVGSSSEEQ